MTAIGENDRSRGEKGEQNGALVGEVEEEKFEFLRILQSC